jgi:hypothetical protein
VAEYKSTWNLETIPDELFYAESARRMTARRKVSGGPRPGAGRPIQLARCPRCGEKVTKTQATRGHGCK